MSGIIYRPPGQHECHPPVGVETIGCDYSKGTVWRCDCDTTWVSQGLTGGGRQRSGGYAAAELEWKRESRRARRKRERQGVTPEELFGGQCKHPTNRVPPPLSSKPCPAQQPAGPAE